MSAESLLRLCLQLYHILVLGGNLTKQLSLIEARMNMESGGVAKQTLRMGVCINIIYNIHRH